MLKTLVSPINMIKTPDEDIAARTDPVATTPKIKVSDLNFYYGLQKSLHEISLDIPGNKVTALIGPSGCGKTTFLRTLNRMYGTVPHSRAEGQVL